ncbi:MAG TPA: hypothetical protein VM537_35785 [Anaerolineae bacterium]|nr:hypothetical protein [Anaerolineae bacterium]
MTWTGYVTCEVKRVFLWRPRYDIDGNLMWGRAYRRQWSDGRVEYTKRRR